MLVRICIRDAFANKDLLLQTQRSTNAFANAFVKSTNLRIVGLGPRLKMPSQFTVGCMYLQIQ